MKSTIKQITAFCVFILISASGFSQSARAAVQASLFHNDMSSQAILQKNIGSRLTSDIKGTPYYEDGFNSASISPLNKVFFVRYNVAFDFMEIIYKKDTLILNKANRSYVIKQNKGNITYKILEHVESNKEDKFGYFVQLTEGDNVKLFRKDRKRFVETQGTAYGTQGKTSAKYKEQKSEYYIEYGNSGTAIKLPKKKKSVIKVFASKEDRVKKFIKEHKIKVTKEQHLVKLINYINSL